MFNEDDITQRAMARRFNLEEPDETETEHLETERIFDSVDDQIAWIQTVANIKLRDRLVWFGITSFAVEMFLVFLHASSAIVLPEAVIVAVSILMGGSGFGLGSLLYFIAKDLFWHR
jgi:hypothetical protein